MADSTLPPTPSYNPNIPIITSAGGTEAAYKDPKSPESIMKKTTLLNAQASVDSMYNVNVSAHEGFYVNTNVSNKNILLFFLCIVVISLFLLKSRKFWGKAFLLVIATLIFLLIVKENGSSGGALS